jgi:hypothetical protein
MGITAAEYDATPALVIERDRQMRAIEARVERRQNEAH